MQVTANPYDIVIPNRDFVEDVLRPVADLPVEHEDGQPSRWQDVGDGWHVIDRLSRIGGQLPRWEGTLLRTWTTEHPYRSGPTYGISPLGLPDGQGVAEHVAFLYDERARLLWLQRDRRIAGKLAFADYLRDLTGQGFSMVMRFRTDGIKRLQGLHVFRRLEIAFMTEELQRPRGTVGQWLDGAQRYGAARMELKLSPVKGGTLDPSTKEIVDDVVATYKDNPDAVAKAQITGKPDEDAEDDFIDLVRDRDYMSVRIAADRSRNPERLIGAVRKIWSDNRHRV